MREVAVVATDPRLQQAFEAYRQDPTWRFQVELRRLRAGQIRHLLASPQSVTLDAFNREVWAFESATSLRGRSIKGVVLGQSLTDEQISDYEQALQQGQLELHGNYVWGSATAIYGAQSPLNTLDSDTKTENIRGALRILNAVDLSPLEKAIQIKAIPGFGWNMTTGMVMLYHPDTFAIMNAKSRQMVQDRGYNVGGNDDLERFERSMMDLHESLDAADFLELDYFLYLIAEGRISLSPRIVKIAPGEQGRFWDECLHGGYICIGWDEVGDLNQYPSKEEYQAQFAKLFGPVYKNNASATSAKANEVWTLRELRPGDIIVANRGMSELLGYGEVVEPGYQWRPDRDSHKHTVNVRWDSSVARQIPEQRHWAMTTVEDVPSKIVAEVFPDLSERIMHPSPLNHTSSWIFQANPARFDIDGALRDLTEFRWSVRQHRQDIHAGDTAFIWKSGGDGGLLGVARVLTEPALTEEAVEERRFNRIPDEFEVPQLRVMIHIDRIVPKGITRQTLMQDTILRGAGFLRASQGTNFSLTPEEAKALRTLADGTSPPSQNPVPLTFNDLYQAVRSEGLLVDVRTVRRYHLSLHTRGFVILSGLSGTGKTWLAEAYARAAGAAYLLVPVAPNWTTNEDLLGYFNPIDNAYHDTEFSRFLRRAADASREAQERGRQPTPYHLILDEMNLARVEYYFARFLSAMETRAREGTATIELGPHERVVLSPNLYFVGTVNVDETTHGFANKVYDRAQLIELGVSRESLADQLGDAPYGDTVLQVWDALHKVAPFAFRIVDDLKAYITHAGALGVPWEDALDEQLLQKVLPKCTGTNLRLGPALQAFLELTQDRFPMSAAKAAEMCDGYQQHGFASYF
jgi:hypothetical protein